jgi:hypothetical protein
VSGSSGCHISLAIIQKTTVQQKGETIPGSLGGVVMAQQEAHCSASQRSALRSRKLAAAIGRTEHLTSTFLVSTLYSIPAMHFQILESVTSATLNTSTYGRRVFADTSVFSDSA